MDKRQRAGWDEDLSPIRDKVYQYLKNAILTGELKAGERIVERDLAEKLNISRTPIREALFRLESQGFVKTLPRRGVVVNRLSVDEVLEIFTLLAVLGGLAVKLAARKANDEDRRKLDELARKIERLLEGDVPEEDVAQFHLHIVDTLYRSAKSPRLYEMLTGLFDYVRAFAHVGYEQPGRLEEALREHLNVLRAVCDGNGELAESLIHVHMENAKQAYLAALRDTTRHSGKTENDGSPVPSEN